MTDRPHGRRPRPVRWAAGVSLAAAPWLAGGWALAAVVLGAIGLGWGRRRADRAVIALLAGAAVAFAVGGPLGRSTADGTPQGLPGLTTGYRTTWDALDRLAEQAAETPPPGPGESDRGQAFLRLARIVAESGRPGATVLLLDPDGEAAAWAGPGLLHDIEALDLPEEGRTYRPSYTAATLLSVRPLGEGARPWRAVAGVSLSTEALPFASPVRLEKRAWTLVDSAPGEVEARDTVRLEAPGAPDLVLAPGSPSEGPSGTGPSGRLGGILTALALLLCSVGPILRRWLSTPAAGGGGSGPGAWWAALAGVAMAGALSLEWPTAVLLAGAALAASGAVRAVRGEAGGAGMAGGEALLAGAGVVALVRGLVAGGWSPTAPVAVLFPLDELALRFALALVLFSALAWIGARPGRPPSGKGEVSRWLGLVLVLVAAATPEHTELCAATGFLGLALSGIWLHRSGRARRPAGLAFACLLSALATGAATEAVDRVATRSTLRADVLPQLGPPETPEVEDVKEELRAWFADLDLERTTLAKPEDLDTQDLAYHLWRRSPLARPGTLSALVVEPTAGRRSSFAFGLPLDDEDRLDQTQRLRDEVMLPGWEEGRIVGSSRLVLRGEDLGELRYWLVLRPGFRLDRSADEGDLVSDLLRGSPGLGQVRAGLPGEALYGLYGPSGRPLVSPWRESPSFPDASRAQEVDRVDTPGGEAWVAARTAPDGIEVLYLPRLTPDEALQRSGAHALAFLAIVVLLAAASLLAAVPARELVRRTRRALRSYSRRLALVYSVVLLVPLLVVNTVTLKILGERVAREQRQVGEAALDSAQRVLGEYVLTLDPGFGIGTAIDDELLFWLSEVVDHQLNLYWGSAVYAASEPALFTAGLLPKRIPGEIYSRLALEGYGRSGRTNQIGGARYLEIYAPLKVPGVGAQANLFLSMPLLAQQEEVAQEVASLRGKTILVTAAVFLLLLAVSVRLARSFTAPLTELVEGTQRIAEGAESLGLQPTETELEALVKAVDRMAERIAEGRRRLLEEKGVVETVVESITAGVVSLNSQGRVVLRNRVAGELLGVEVGDRLVDHLAADERLSGVARWLAEAADGARHETFRLPRAEGEETEWSVVRVPLPGTDGPAALVVVEDVTEVLRGQRLQAWAEMARIIAHEIKNPLTPIQLSTEHMREVYASDRDHFDRVFESCTRNILRQVEELRQISGEFSTYSRIPRFEPRVGDVVADLRELVAGYRSAASSGVEVTFEATAASLEARYDRRLLGRALRNLVENALRAATAGPGGRVRVRVAEVDDAVHVAVEDTGPGVPSDQLGRIFDPYFSTHSGGTGLGLPISRRIVEQHGGGIGARNLPDGGFEVALWLPLHRNEVRRDEVPAAAAETEPRGGEEA